MQIALKNIKTFTGMEGHGFNATLYINGVNRGMVSDDAHGGPYRFDDWKAFEEIAAYSKQVNPNYEEANGLSAEYDKSFRAEDAVNKLFMRQEVLKQLGRQFNTTISWVGEDGKVHVTKKLTAEQRATFRTADQLKKWKGVRFIESADEYARLCSAEDGQDVFAFDPVLDSNPAAAVAAKAAVAIVEKTTAPIPQQPVLGSKMDRCRTLYNQNVSMRRADMIKLFVSQADCTPAGAATYYQKLARS